MSRPRWIASALASTSCILAMALWPGCGESPASICEETCDCVGCSDEELDECIDSGEDFEKLASDEGCEDQFDDYISCYGEQLECRGSEVDADGCDHEYEALEKCLGDAGFKGSGGGGSVGPSPSGGSGLGGPGNACDQFAEEYAQCCQSSENPDIIASCEEAIDSIKKSDPQTCQSVAAQFECPY